MVRLADDQELLVRIDERTQSLKEALDNHVKAVNLVLKDHNTRIRTLEVRGAYLVGAAAGGGAIAGVVGGVLIRLIGG